ncbi:MAG: extracellular solute-binding protein [Anaerolineae bacterium]|nr:extracellular solute-binding protein [Anaerolineae bacterium]
MTKIEFSTMFVNDTALEALRLSLQEFETQHNVQVNLRVLSWDTAWSNLVKMALYKSGPDVSEIGTTWIDTLISLNVLRQFSAYEVGMLGGPSVFLPSVWQSRMWKESQVWAIPWLMDTRVIYYRRDFLQQAGIDELTAFNSFEQLNLTLQRLQENGVEMPLAIPTAPQHLTLHLLAAWVWTLGGRFLSPNGKRVFFHLPEARAGIKAYFDLRRYLAPSVHNLTDSDADLLFQVGKVAVIITGYWILDLVRRGNVAAEVRDNLGVAIFPGTPYVGGSDLVIWQQCRHPEVAFALVRHLTSQQVQTEVIARSGLLPGRREALGAPPFTADPHYRVVGESLKKGRSFRATYLWGLIEDKLVITIGQLWRELLADPELDIEQTVSKYIEPLAKELNHSLTS